MSDQAHVSYTRSRRDVVALLRLIESTIDTVLSPQDRHASWPEAGSMATLREDLIDIAIGIGLMRDHDESAIRSRIEAALKKASGEVAEALVDAVVGV